MKRVTEASKKTRVAGGVCKDLFDGVFRNSAVQQFHIINIRVHDVDQYFVNIHIT